MIQEILAYIIVGVAVAFSVKTFIRQFSGGKDACPKCSHCGPAGDGAAQQPDGLIQIKDRVER